MSDVLDEVVTLLDVADAIRESKKCSVDAAIIAASNLLIAESIDAIAADGLAINTR